jgi:HTH-type transcriptional regulator/antitoxin HipB
MKTLRETRESKGVTKKAVARHIGVTEKTYAKYEQHPSSVTIENAEAISKFLGVKVQDIFFASNSK